jgi:hypothetical protein
MKTLNEQIDRIKSVMGLILEQPEYESFISANKFVNCRGIRLTSKGGSDGNGGGGGGLDKSQTVSWWENMTNPEMNQISEEGKKEAEKFHQIYPNDDYLKFFTALNRESIRFNNFNTTGNYDKYFSADGKQMGTPKYEGAKAELMQNAWRNSVCYVISSDPWMFYYRVIFGNKTDTTYQDFFNLFKTSDTMKKVVESFYDKKRFVAQANKLGASCN